MCKGLFTMSTATHVCRVLRCNYALPMKIKGGDKGFSHQAVWADADRSAPSHLQQVHVHDRFGPSAVSKLNVLQVLGREAC